jgi:hypothetical protein
MRKTVHTESETQWQIDITFYQAAKLEMDILVAYLYSDTFKKGILTKSPIEVIKEYAQITSDKHKKEIERLINNRNG